MAPLFEARGITYHVEYINSYRDWNNSLPQFATMFGAYRRRSIEDKGLVPHSFTFVRRESTLALLMELARKVAFAIDRL